MSSRWDGRELGLGGRTWEHPPGIELMTNLGDGSRGLRRDRHSLDGAEGKSTGRFGFEFEPSTTLNQVETSTTMPRGDVDGGLGGRISLQLGVLHLSQWRRIGDVMGEA